MIEYGADIDTSRSFPTMPIGEPKDSPQITVIAGDQCPHTDSHPVAEERDQMKGTQRNSLNTTAKKKQ